MTDHYHAGDSSPCDKDCPPSRHETSEADKKLVREILMKHGICSSEGEDALVADLASALQIRELEIEWLQAENKQLVEETMFLTLGDLNKVTTLRGKPFTYWIGLETRTQALTKALKQIVAVETKAFRIQSDEMRSIAQVALDSHQPGEQGNLPTFTALGDPLQPGEEGRPAVYDPKLLEQVEFQDKRVLIKSVPYVPEEPIRRRLEQAVIEAARQLLFESNRVIPPSDKAVKCLDNALAALEHEEEGRRG